MEFLLEGKSTWMPLIAMRISLWLSTSCSVDSSQVHDQSSCFRVPVTFAWYKIMISIAMKSYFPFSVLYSFQYLNVRSCLISVWFNLFNSFVSACSTTRPSGCWYKGVSTGRGGDIWFTRWNRRVHSSLWGLWRWQGTGWWCSLGVSLSSWGIMKMTGLLAFE